MRLVCHAVLIRCRTKVYCLSLYSFLLGQVQSIVGVAVDGFC